MNPPPLQSRRSCYSRTVISLGAGYRQAVRQGEYDGCREVLHQQFRLVYTVICSSTFASNEALIRRPGALRVGGFPSQRNAGALIGPRTLCRRDRHFHNLGSYRISSRVFYILGIE